MINVQQQAQFRSVLAEGMVSMKSHWAAHNGFTGLCLESKTQKSNGRHSRQKFARTASLQDWSLNWATGQKSSYTLLTFPVVAI